MSPVPRPQFPVSRFPHHGALRRVFHRGFNGVEGGGLLEITRQINHRHVGDGDAKRETREFSCELGKHFTHRFGGAGGGGDDVEQSAAAPAPVLVVVAILRGSDPAHAAATPNKSKASMIQNIIINKSNVIELCNVFFLLFFFAMYYSLFGMNSPHPLCRKEKRKKVISHPHHGGLRHGEGVHGGHEPVLQPEVVVDDLGEGRRAVGSSSTSTCSFIRDCLVIEYPVHNRGRSSTRSFVRSFIHSFVTVWS